MIQGAFIKLVNMKTYTYKEIQAVYKQFNKKPSSVVYSDDGGYTWKSVPMDSGKWNPMMFEVDGKRPWMFAFIK